MNERALRPLNIAAATALIGGVLVAFLPQHALSIAGIAILTVAAGAAMHALAVNAPAAWWYSPFDTHTPIGGRRAASDEVALLRSRFSGARQHIPGGPALPPAAIRMLRPLIAVAIERSGLDPDGDAARSRLSPVSRAILDAPDATVWFRLRIPDEARTAAVVQYVLDDLDRLVSRAHANTEQQQAPSSTTTAHG